MEERGTRTGITAIGVDRVAADKAPAYCPRVEGLVTWAFVEPMLSIYL
jgi:hypothetical protein